MAKSKVAVLKVRPETILSDIGRLCELAGLRAALDGTRPTIVREQLAWHYPLPAANTTPWQLEGTLIALRDSGFTDVSLVQSESVVTDAAKGEDLNHYLPLVERYQVPVLYNFKPADMKWLEYRPKARLHALHKVFPGGIFIPDYFFGKNVVHLPTMKCHAFATTSGAMENAVSGLLDTKRHYTQSWIHRTLVDLLAIQKEIHAGLFAVMDGTTAGNGPGPRTLLPVVKDYVLASQDQVAIDAVAAKMMGFDPLSIEYLNVAHEDGLGVADPRDIEIVGADITHESWGFSVGENVASKVGEALWFGPLKGLQNLLFRTPLVNVLALGSEVYHDRYRWPRKEQQVFADWQTNTAWGRLFEAYGSNESDRITRSAPRASQPPSSPRVIRQ
jgi:uncharacterized protein (DUF362 family)